MRRSGVTLVLAVGVVSALGTAGRVRDGAPVGTRPAPRPSAQASSAFQLFASTNLLLDANRVQCNINNIGEQCVDPSNSSVIGGGFWPKGTGGQYIFNSGLQLAAILGGSRHGEPPFPWAGDTVGAFIFDARGDQMAGSPLTGVWNSRNPADLAEWPSAAYVRDPALFDASLLGERTASEQDSWVRYWDAGPREVPGRPRPMGLLVDQRTLAWNGPYANRDILYVIHRLINVTARAPSRYAGLSAAGYTAADIAEIARLGAQFQDSVEAKYHVDLPDTGFAWTDLYVGMGQDPDVGDAGRNYDTAILPFAMATAYKSNFWEPSWQYPADVFFPPFAAAPGFVGTKFLLAANGLVTGGSAIRMFTNTTGGSSFPDRFGVAALWRMLARQLLPAEDGYCPVTTPGSPVCLVYGVAHDTRWYMSSGPWPAVAPGESVVFAIAYVFAPAVAAAFQTPIGSSNLDFKPGIPSIGPRLLAGTDTVRQIERAAGWLTFADANGDGDLQTREVGTVPFSLLHKAAVAQAFFDNRFLAPTAPSAPRFAVLPGDGQATVVWERSIADVTGDPYFPLAADPLSPLYDPNFRQFDVEGYRVWRGRSLASMEIVAQFDYTGTSLTDHTGQVYGPSEPVGQCAPDLGIVTDCRADFLHGQSRAVPLAGTVVQIPPGGRVALGDGRVMVIRADTAVTGGASGVPALGDTGVPFAFVDSGLQNGTTYVYGVTAFDVNSVNSGPTSLESDLVGKTVTPRIASSNVRSAIVETGMYGGDGTRLDQDTTFPAINAADGTLSGRIPPANGGRIELVQAVQELLPQGEYTLVVDSVSPGFPSGAGTPQPRMYFSVLGASAALRGSTEVLSPGFLDPTSTASFSYVGPLVPYDSAQASRFGVRFGPDARMLVRFAGLATTVGASSIGAGRAGYNGYSGSVARWTAHSRWYDDGAAEPPNPTIDPFGSRAHTNGLLTGVSTIYSPLVYRLPISGGAAVHAIPSSRYRDHLYATVAAWYPADFVVRWGSGGQITVSDSTHRTDLPYKAAVQPGFGFLDAAAIVAAGVTSSQLADGSSGVTFDPAVMSYYSLRSMRPVCTVTSPTVPCAALQPTARLQPVDVTNDGVSDGTGIALVVNGEPFFMLMTALPAPGTVWHLRAVGGGSMSATCVPAQPGAQSELLPGGQPTSCSGYTYTPPPVRPAYVPGLRYTIRIVRQFGADTTAASDLSRIHTVPDPLYFTNAPSIGASPAIRFVNLPERAIIRIYSQSGILVTMLTHNDQTAGGEVTWDVKNRWGTYVASGVYFYHVETPDHRVKIGRFTVVQQAWP